MDERTEDVAAAEELMAIIDHRFTNRAILDEALTHASYRNENKDVEFDNERLEFLGDAILGAAVSHLLLAAWPDQREGVLTRYKAVLVSEQGLAETARQLGLGRFLRLGRGELMSRGRDKTSVLADAVEALIAAVYLDAGFDAAFELVQRLFGDRMRAVGGAEERVDFKTKLQELVQLRHRIIPVYRIVHATGPDHAREFLAEVVVADQTVASGIGRSKKEAQQDAARRAFQALTDPPP